MDIRALSIKDAFEVTPRQFPDDRGVFLESFRGDRLAEAVGHRLDIIQTNVSVSSKGTIRGVHYADVPPSQAKYVTALSGSFIDFVIRHPRRLPDVRPLGDRPAGHGRPPRRLPRRRPGPRHLFPRYDECLRLYAELTAGA